MWPSDHREESAQVECVEQRHRDRVGFGGSNRERPLTAKLAEQPPHARENGRRSRCCRTVAGAVGGDARRYESTVAGELAEGLRERGADEAGELIAISCVKPVLDKRGVDACREDGPRVEHHAVEIERTASCAFIEPDHRRHRHRSPVSPHDAGGSVRRPLPSRGMMLATTITRHVPPASKQVDAVLFDFAGTLFMPSRRPVRWALAAQVGWSQAYLSGV